MKQLQDNEVYYKPVGILGSLILCYIFIPTLCILSNCPFWLTAICASLLVLETFSWIKRSKEVIVLNTKGILLFRVMGKNKKTGRVYLWTGS